jgi:hypothetical protein
MCLKATFSGTTNYRPLFEHKPSPTDSSTQLGCRRTRPVREQSRLEAPSCIRLGTASRAILSGISLALVRVPSGSIAISRKATSRNCGGNIITYLKDLVITQNTDTAVPFRKAVPNQPDFDIETERNRDGLDFK